ncbi:MAG: choice-of-anchor D domain-containing protein [Sporocytophaga sp.]|uniref:glycosyl hydrolase family 8 n=1 Tax=Sporocytophaga sp. TaxID=2231183 RepID=UPI001B268EFB|nr:glycosyl hydrolase family 8 [Sporocytophaga sp.]MBO9699430.1 choice-of-anchor D domain-containing protein [Sporocytophaga sp.]
MIKQYSLRLCVFLICCFFSLGAIAQINTPAGAVVPFNANPKYANGIMPKNLPTSGAFGKSTDAANAYNEWKEKYTESCGSGKWRVKFDDPSKTVSEGIAYGMLLSAYAADKALFDGLWAFYKANSNNGFSFMNWKTNGCVANPETTGGATDADLDVAFALLIAKTQWPSGTYGTDATNLINAIKQSEIHSSGIANNGNGWGMGSVDGSNGRQACVNPSYQSPAYYKVFKDYTKDNSWDNAVNGGYNLINANAHATTGLVSDWSSNTGVRNTCNNSGTGSSPTDGYGYDACRNPWRMAQDVIWNNETKAKSILGKITTYLAGKGASNVRGPLYQDGGLYTGNAHNATFVSTFAVAVMGSTNQTLMDQMYTETVNTKDLIQNQTLSGYYGNTLRCISLFMMTGNFWPYGTTSEQEINVRQGSVNIENNATFDFQNGQIGVGKSINFTIENLGFAPLTFSGSPIVVLTPTTDFTVTTQPASSPLALNANTVFTVKFNPTSAGLKTATITIASNDADEGTYKITLVGTGTTNATAPKLIAKDVSDVVIVNNGTFNLGNVTAGATGTQKLKIINKGDAPLNLSKPTPVTDFILGGTHPTSYSVTNTLPLTIAKGDSAYITIKFVAPGTIPTDPVATTTLKFATDDPSNATFTLNLKAKIVDCATSLTASKVLNDYDGNLNVKHTWDPNPVNAFSQTTANPSVTGLNLSATVASYTRPATGDYEIIRYYPCAGTTFDGITAATPAISMLVYSPGVGVKITVAAQTGSEANKTVAPIDPTNYKSNVEMYTTKANQWERITFDFSWLLKSNKVNQFTILDIQIDPLRKYTGLPATFYIDDIRYAGLPCVNDLPTSQVLLDFDNHNNVSLAYDNSSLSAPIANPSSILPNTSSNVALFSKKADTKDYSDGIRYLGCAGTFDLSSKKMVSMLVYSSVAGAPINFNAKVPDDMGPGGPDAGNIDPDDAVSATATTVFANRWHRIYFDLSAVPTSLLSQIFAFDIFIDPLATKGAQTYYFDDIRYETAAPCVAGIPATKILNDFDDNRYLDIAFPGTFNTIYPNPVTAGINNSATVGQFVRDAGTTTGTSFRFKACQSNIDLGAGKAIINLMVNSPNVGTTFVMSLKNAAGTQLSSVEATTAGTAGTWEELSFDHSAILNSTDVAFIDVIVDPNAKFSAAGSSVGARTYLVDNLRYGYDPAQPEINVRAQTATPTNILTTQSFNMGTISVGDSSAAITFSIQNNGLVDLLLNGTPDLAIAGANPGDFIISKSPTYTTNVGALSASNFVVRFKPTAGGARSASITIKNNDSNEGSYIIYLNGTAKQPTMSVKQGATLYNATSAAYDFGTSLLNTATTPVTFTITSTGDDTLRLSGTPVVTITGTNATDFSVSQPVVTKLHPSTGTALTTTFTVTFKPTTSGVKNAVINIGNNSSVNPYTFKVTGNGDCPLPTAPLAGPDQSTCDASVALAGNTPTVGTGTWSIVGTSSATIKTPSSATSVVENLTAGQSVTLRWTIANTCGTNFDDVVITRNVTPNVSFPDVSSVCAGGSVDLFPTVTGGSQPYAYTWTASAGTIPTGAIPTVTPSTTTTYSLVVKDANNCSNVAVQKVISVNAKPVLTVTPATSDICSGGSALLTANATGGTAPYSYAWDSAPALVINNDKATASPSATSTYFVTASDANGCTSDKKSALVNVTSGGVASVTISPATVAVCDGTPVTLTANSANGGVPTYEWYVNGNKVTAGVNGGEFTSSALPNNAQVTVKMTSSIACATGSPAISSATTVTVNSLPSVAVNTSAAEICNGGSVNVSAVVNNGKAPYAYVWTSSVGNKPADAGSSLSPTETTTYSVQVTDANNCKNTLAASKQVVVNAKPSVAVTPSSTDVCTGQSAVLTATVTGGTAPFSYQWTNVVGNTASVTVSPTAETTYSVVVTDSKSCQSAAATSLVKVSSSVEAKVTIVSSIDKACDAGTNATFTLTSQGGGTTPVYAWSINNINAGLNAETYTALVKPGDIVKVVMTSNLACAIGSPATSNVITIASAPTNICVAPTKKNVIGPASVTAGDQATYTTEAAPEGSVYSWTLPEGATIVDHNQDYSTITVKFGSNGGSIVLRETNPAGSTDSDPVNVVVTPAGISALLSSSVNVMPNPGVDFVVTLGEVFTGNVNIIVKNALGTSVLEENVFKGSSSADYNVNLSGFASGIYFLEIRTEQGSAVKRLIKQ